MQWPLKGIGETSLAGFRTPTNLETLRIAASDAPPAAGHATLEFALSLADTEQTA